MTTPSAAAAPSSDLTAPSPAHAAPKPLPPEHVARVLSAHVQTIITKRLVRLGIPEQVTLLQQLRGQIQTVADASPETSASLIQSAGIAVRKTPVRAKRAFTAKPGAVSGSVLLVTDAAARRAFYEWQYSADGGKTWLAAGSTLKTSSTVPGLTPGASVMFRYRAGTKAGEGDWSQTATIIVKWGGRAIGAVR
jgi:hypothetical protein